MYKKVSHIITSHYSEHLELEISDKQLKFCSIPWYSLFNEFVVEIQSVFGKIHLNKTMKRSDKYLNLSSLRQGNYFFNLYIADNINKTQNVALMYENIMIEICNDNASFILPICYEKNLEFINNIPVSKNALLKYTLSTKSIECHKPEISSLAKEICKFSHNDYNRLLCIHDWIAQNLYYDMDSYNSGDYAINTHKAIDCIKCGKKCVCSDFTYLTVALARSLSIPTICITCKTEDKKGCWDGELNQPESDHIFAASFVNNRWILMDNTWDCGNQIVNGVFHKRAKGYDRKYFDISIEVLSSTHRLVEIYV